MKLWSYGDSHPAGHELGTEYAHDLGASWFASERWYSDDPGTTVRNVCRNRLGVEKYNKIVKQKWYKHIHNQCTPSLSYAGVLAEHLGAELVNRAEPGSSNSLSILKMYQDIGKYQPEDIVLFSVVTPFRYIPANDIDATNHQIHWLPLHQAEVLWDVGPHEVCFKLQSHGYIQLAKSLHSNTVTLKTVNDDWSVQGRSCTFDIPLSFYEYTTQQVDDPENGIDPYRYPGGHLHESLHKMYGDYLYATYSSFQS